MRNTMNVRNTLVLKLLVKRSQIHSYSDSNTYSDSKSHRFLRKGNVYCISFFQVNSLTPPVSKFPMILRGEVFERFFLMETEHFLDHVSSWFPLPLPRPPRPVLGFLFFFLLFFQIKFYFGQNENCSLGNNTSDSSEELLQRGSGEDQYVRFWFGSMEYNLECGLSHLCLVFNVNIRFDVFN